MSHIQNVSITAQDSSALDAFGRWRVSQPHTLFDSKQIFDNQPLFWDEELESGGGITSAYSADEAATTITSTLNTAGLFTRQTFQRFNYQPGKSQLVAMTGVLDDSGGGAGVKRRLGIFDDENGFFFEDDTGTIGVVQRSKATGSIVDTRVAQSSWNLDTMDGSGPSGITMDWTKAAIFVFDYEWLGVGRARIGMYHNGVLQYIHEFLNDNSVNTAYMSTPNLPLRYQMVTTGSSPASTLVAICGMVMSEGGAQDRGVIQARSTGGANLAPTTENIIYALIGIRLKAAYIGQTIQLLSASILEYAGDKNFEVLLLWNPTVAGTFTFVDLAGSAIQTVLGAATNTVTGGTLMGSIMQSSAKKGSAEEFGLQNSLTLGASISNVVDEIVLAVRPVGGSSAMTVEGSLTWRELS